MVGVLCCQNEPVIPTLMDTPPASLAPSGGRLGVQSAGGIMDVDERFGEGQSHRKLRPVT